MLSTASHHAPPVLIEVAINGARAKSLNPHVPLTEDEIVQDILDCVDAGASIVHAHAGEPVVGGRGHHGSAAYLRAFARVRERHPPLLMYPTLPGGGSGTTMARRLAHVVELANAGVCQMVPVDPGTMNYGRVDADGRPPAHEQVYQTTFADVDWAFALCRERNLACTMSLFEPGFARLVEAHFRAGTLPRSTLVKLEFSAGERLFGLAPDALGVDAWLSLFDARRIAWMVTLRDGSPADALARLAIGRGGHVRVGIEDYGGPGTPRNAELVAQIAGLCASMGRRPARPDEVLQLIEVKGDK
jgi:uncharacterized protein (DUF849 family)